MKKKRAAPRPPQYYVAPCPRCQADLLVFAIPTQANGPRDVVLDFIRSPGFTTYDLVDAYGIGLDYAQHVILKLLSKGWIRHIGMRNLPGRGRGLRLYRVDFELRLRGDTMHDDAVPQSRQGGAR